MRFVAAGRSLCAVMGATCAAASAVAAQAPTSAVRGTAVVHVDPVSADTLPLLCVDPERPELGFETETSDPEWTPRLALTLTRPTGDPSQAEVVLELDGARYSSTFPAGESGEGYYTAVAMMTGSGTPPTRMVSFTAHCAERLVRGG